MLPDPMDIIEEPIRPVALPAPQKATQVQAAVISEDPLCRGPYDGRWYRRCENISSGVPFSTITENIRCEHFYFSRYAFSDPNAFVSRRNMSVLALSMARNNKNPISITQEMDFTNLHNDLKSPMFPWTKPMVESDLARHIVTRERTSYEPARPVTRSEAFSMIMASICMYPKAGPDGLWQKNIYDVAVQEDLTVQSWKHFRPDDAISVKELAYLVTRAANWAEETGGCSIKPVQCQ